MSHKTAVATPENPRNIRERIIEMIEEFGNAPDDFDPGKIADEAIRLLAEDRHVLAQQFVEAVTRKTVQEAGNWLARQPYSAESVVHRRVAVKDIAWMIHRGEMPR